MQHNHFWGMLTCAAIAFSVCSSARGQIIGVSTSSGTVGYTIVGFGPIGSVGPAAIPGHPGSQILGPIPGPAGNFAAFAQTWGYSSPQVAVSIQHSSFTSFVTEVVQDADATPTAGLATVASTFSVAFTVGAGGLPATVQTAEYGFGGLIGPAGGFAEFTAHINFMSSIAGDLGSIDLSYTTTTPGPISGSVLGSRVLPSLSPSSTLTVSGTFTLKVDDNLGDGLVTEFGVVPIPEPSTLSLLGVGFVAIGTWRRGRQRALFRNSCQAGTKTDWQN